MSDISHVIREMTYHSMLPALEPSCRNHQSRSRSEDFQLFSGEPQRFGG